MYRGRREWGARWRGSWFSLSNNSCQHIGEQPYVLFMHLGSGYSPPQQRNLAIHRATSDQLSTIFWLFPPVSPSHSIYDSVSKVHKLVVSVVTKHHSFNTDLKCFSPPPYSFFVLSSKEAEIAALQSSDPLLTDKLWLDKHVNVTYIIKTIV